MNYIANAIHSLAFALMAIAFFYFREPYWSGFWAFFCFYSALEFEPKNNTGSK